MMEINLILKIIGELIVENQGKFIFSLHNFTLRRKVL